MIPTFQIGVCTRDEAKYNILRRLRIFQGDAEIHFVSLAEVTPSPRFSARIYQKALSTNLLGQHLLVTACIPSTQTLLHQNFASLPDGVICVADTQTAGKGRGSNSWTSPMGCLMFSAYKRIDIAGQNLPFVQYVASLAIVNAIQKTCKVQNSSLDVRIKWPNDIYANDLKIGGLLCQSIYRDGNFHLIIGAGLNVNNAEPTTCLANLTKGSHSPNVASTHEISREDLLACIANYLEDYLQTLAEEGFAPLKPLYLRAWLHTGQKVTLEEQVDGGLKSISLTITGISNSGFLTASDERKELYELHPDGNSLDFFTGLVRHKTLQKEHRRT